jgi:hypothetical protein
MTRETTGLIHFGKGGHTLEFLPHRDAAGRVTQSGHLSGYDSPELFLWELNGGKYPDYAIADGVPVLDVRARVEQPGGISVALRGPLVDLSITDDTIERLPAAGIMAAAMMAEPGNQYGQMLRHHATVTTLEPDEPGPLDRVSVARYLGYWRTNGGRIGTMTTIDGKRAIAWEDGGITEGFNPYAEQWAAAAARRIS